MAQVTKDLDHLAGPAWDNSTEYPSIESMEFIKDEQFVIEEIAKIAQVVEGLMPLLNRSREGVELSEREKQYLIRTLQELSPRREQASLILRNLSNYVYCELSVDAKSIVAAKKNSELSVLYSKLDQAAKSSLLFLRTAPERLFDAYLDSEATRAERFLLSHERGLKDILLSDAEEKLISALQPNGPFAWANLYDAISGSLQCRLIDPEHPSTDVPQVGLSQAAGMLRNADEKKRRIAWHAIQNAWSQQEESCSAILNGLAGWRLELTRKRSHSRPVDFLTHPLHHGRIQPETLKAMLNAVQQRIESPRRALKLIARGLGKKRLDPWDLMAPPPKDKGGKSRSFNDGLELVVRSFEAVDPEFGEFARLMARNRWIEGRVLPTKRQGAYCIGFKKSKTPRVFQTYMGTIADIKTLAHELGHAYHSWVIRDLPMAEVYYPMTLAETASIFAETAFADEFSRSGDDDSRFEIAWQSVESAASFLLNIPARFTFEKRFYETRQTRFVPASELRELTEQAWQEWYGDSLSRPDPMYWASKLHFSMSDVSFYNFPYTFGYLFSLGIYAQRERMGADFFRAYKEILRDTGRMTAEDLVQKHLNEDITQTGFWLKSIAIVENKIDEFERLLAKRTTSPEVALQL